MMSLIECFAMHTIGKHLVVLRMIDSINSSQERRTA